MPIIFVNDDVDHPYLTAPVALVDRIRRAAKWCRQTECQFVKSAIEDKLDEVAYWKAKRQEVGEGRMKTPTASKIIEKQSSSASIREVQKLIECEKKRKLIEMVGLWEGIEVYKHPTTIKITVKEEQEYSLLVKEYDKKNPLNPSRALYDCESAKSLFERLLRILGLCHQIEVQVKTKEE